MVMEWNRAWWREGSEVFSGGGGWGRLLRGRDAEQRPQGRWRVSLGRGVLARGKKARFLIWGQGRGVGGENPPPTSQNCKVSNEGKFICEIIKFPAGKRDSELFSWSFNPSPRPPGNSRISNSEELVVQSYSRIQSGPKCFYYAVWRRVQTLLVFKNFDIVMTSKHIMVFKKFFSHFTFIAQPVLHQVA